MKEMKVSRRGFVKAAVLCAGYAALGTPLVRASASAGNKGIVTARQTSVYKADAKIYKLRKSQDNPMVQKLYNPQKGYLHDGPCGHMSHHLLHTHYVDRSQRINALKEKGFEFNL